MSNRVVADAGTCEPLDEEIGEFRVLGIGAHHVASAGRLRRAAHKFAVDHLSWDQAGELLALDDAIRVAFAKPEDGGEGYGGVRQPAAPVRIDLGRAPSLNILRHVVDRGGKILDGLDAIRSRDAWFHVLVE